MALLIIPKGYRLNKEFINAVRFAGVKVAEIGGLLKEEPFVKHGDLEVHSTPKGTLLIIEDMETGKGYAIFTGNEKPHEKSKYVEGVGWVYTTTWNRIRKEKKKILRSLNKL